MLLRLKYVHSITVQTTTLQWLTHENFGGGSLFEVGRLMSTWRQCRSCGRDYMWSERDENLVTPTVSPIKTSVFYKLDEIFICRDFEGDRRDEVTYDEMIKKRGAQGNSANGTQHIRVARRPYTEYGRIFKDTYQLVAVLNAALYNISTEVTTISGKIVVKPIETKKE
jgi:hypothetical protein